MPSSDIRKTAREALASKWGKGVCMILAYLLIEFAISFILGLFKSNEIMKSLLSIAEIIISVPLTFGLTISFIKLKRNEDVSTFDFLQDGFARFGKSWGIYGYTLLKLLLPIICMILLITLTCIVVIIVWSTSGFKMWFAVLLVAFYIATIIYIVSRSLLYSLAYYISYDEPKLSSKECVNKSEDLMKGNRGNLFTLYLSFIGWAILSCLTLGIGFLWLIPYIQVSMVCFYERVSNKEI